jgi:hypothetical protein
LHLKPKASDVSWLPWSERCTTSAGFLAARRPQERLSTDLAVHSLAVGNE